MEKLRTAGGFYIFNLKKMRADRLEDKFIACAEQNLHRLRQPEQDVINLVCRPYITHLPANTLICSYLYDIYKKEADFYKDYYYSAEEVRAALATPVQLHFAGTVKPWKYLNCTASEIWHRYVFQTAFARDYLTALAAMARGRA